MPGTAAHGLDALVNNKDGVAQIIKLSCTSKGRGVANSLLLPWMLSVSPQLTKPPYTERAALPDPSLARNEANFKGF